MRSISRKAVETMQARRDFYASAEITFADGTEKALGKSDFTLAGNSIIDSAESNSFPLGILASKRVTLSLMNDDDRWSEYDFYGAKIYLETKYDLDDGTTESFAIGTFTVVTPESYGTVISVTAMDDSYKTDKAYATSLSYPMSLDMALRDSCSSCGITLIGEVPNSDYVIPSAPTDLTHRQFIGMCAMIAGGNAKFDERNRLLIVPYDFSAFEKLNLWDGGSFKPWTEGEEKDGGTFSPWTTGEIADGGTFGDRDNIHVLHEFASGMTLEVDDVVITGVQMESEDEEGKAKTHLYGSEGYVLSLENQLAKGREDAALALIGKKIVGLRFRPFSGNHIALPTAEFMDLAMIVDWKQNVYQTVLTDVTFNYFGFTALKCAADSPIRNSSKRYGSETKAIIQARQMVEREKTEREKAVEILADELANSNGLYMTEERQDDGSTVYYMHDKPTKGESKVVWKLTANAFGVSTDGGKTYPYGLDANGMAILDRIYAIGLDAGYIKTGAIEISKNGKQMVLMDYDTGQVIIRPDTFELSSGATIESIAEGKAKTAADGALNSAKGYTDTTAQSTLQSANGYADTAASDAVNDFVSKTYNPKIADLQKQLDGQIESYYYNYAPSLDNIPASNWATETDKQKHEGDLFYNRTTGYAYRFFKDSTAWKWQLIQDTDITKAIEQAAAAQDTADHKRRVFVATPKPPYDIGDLWVQGTNGDIMRCQTAKSSTQSYASGDWVKASKYTDDSALKTFIDGDFATLSEQADKKAETWYQTSDPSTGWTSAEKTEHTGDLWYNSTASVQKYYRWNGSSWAELKSTPPDAVFNQINGKAQVFVATPKPPYYKGDLWYGGTSSDVKVCTNTRTNGNYVEGDWSKQDRYIDQAAANTAASSAVNGQTQRDIFNKLTNNGKNSGIYLDGDSLYVNADYINTGAFEVLDESGNPIFSVDKDTKKVVINGDALVEGSVKAKKIDVDDIFAQNITATGTIKGVKLEGATGTFKGDVHAVSFSLSETKLTKEFTSVSTFEIGRSGYQSGYTVAPMSHFLVINGAGLKAENEYFIANEAVTSCEKTDLLHAKEARITELYTAEIYEKGSPLSDTYTTNTKLDEKLGQYVPKTKAGLYSGAFHPVAVGTYAYVLVSSLIRYSEAQVFVQIGDVFSQWVYFNKLAKTEQTLTGWGGDNWYAMVTVHCDFTNGRVGIRTNKIEGWTSSNISIQSVIGIS